MPSARSPSAPGPGQPLHPAPRQPVSRGRVSYAPVSTRQAFSFLFRHPERGHPCFAHRKWGALSLPCGGRGSAGPLSDHGLPEAPGARESTVHEQDSQDPERPTGQGAALGSVISSLSRLRGLTQPAAGCRAPRVSLPAGAWVCRLHGSVLCTRNPRCEIFPCGAENMSESHSQPVGGQEICLLKTLLPPSLSSPSIPLPYLFPVTQDCHSGTLACHSARIGSCPRPGSPAAPGVSGPRPIAVGLSWAELHPGSG